MRLWQILGVAGTLLAGRAAAEPSLEIRGAAARVTVIAESRRDIAISVTRSNIRLPLRVRTLGDRVYLTGDVGRQVHGCRGSGGAAVVSIRGRGAIPLEQLPVILVRTPLVVRLIAGEAVFGEIGRSLSVDFTNQGCGDWSVADVRGRLRLNQAGAGDTRSGAAGSSDLNVAGSGGISTGDIRGAVTAVSSGSGAIQILAAHGSVDARVAGPGDIRVGGGAVTDMTVSIAGSGVVSLHGTARSLHASIAGSGDVNVDRVTGTVTKQVFGSGVVRVGP